MHTYSVWTDEHKMVLFGLAIVSVAAASAAHFVCSFIPGTVAAPSAFAIYGMLFLCFDHKLWKWKLFRNIGLIRTPNFNGEWDGEFESSLTPEKKLSGTLVIHQTWTKMNLFFDGIDSECHSRMASITALQPNIWRFSWQYESTIKNRSKLTNSDIGSSSDRIHYGTTMITATTVATTSENDLPYIMNGHYYTDKDRMSYGQATFKKKQ